MKPKKILIGGCIALVLILGLLIWWRTPYSMIKIAPTEVSNIAIFNGNTGESITVTNASDIEHIIQNLKGVKLHREKLSIGYVGYTFRITIYKVNGEIYQEFIINSNDTIRKDPFFYRDPSESIDYEFIRELFEH